MAAIIQPSLSPSLDYKEVSRQLESFQQVDSTRQQLLARLLQRLSELDTALQAANSDLEDQTSIRRQWKKRAEVAEASLAQNEFILALVDGNRYTFADSYLENTVTGGEDAARDIVEQIRSYIQKRSLHNDPSKVSLMVHIFANKTALSQALIDSGTISESRQLDNFIAQFMRSRPFLYFLDCGSLEGAVDSKIQESYEFHFDNAHCKHLLLALRHESGYITELDTYCEDESTLARTSLMRSSHAVVSKLASGFHFASTPALRTIALISLEHVNATKVEKTEASSPSVIRIRLPSRNRDLHGLFEVDDQDSPATEREGIHPPNGIDHDPREFDSSTTSGTAAVPSNGTAAEPLEPVKSPPLTQKAQGAPSPKPAPVRHSSTAPYLAPVQSYMNEWENAPSTDMYTPPPDLRPWGSEDTPSLDNFSKSKSNGGQTAKKVNRNASRDATSRTSDAAEQISVGKFDRQHAGKGATSSPTDGKARQNLGQSPPPRRNPEETPEFVLRASWTASSGLLGSKFSSPSIETFGPHFSKSATVAINRHGERVDLPLSRPSAEDQARFDSRWQSVKLCNEHHLRGECSAQHCKFDHDPIDEGVRLALRVSARKISCKLGTECRRADCTCGHHCPYRLKSRCTNKQCPFLARGMHKVDDLTVDKFVQAN